MRVDYEGKCQNMYGAMTDDSGMFESTSWKEAMAFRNGEHEMRKRAMKMSQSRDITEQVCTRQSIIDLAILGRMHGRMQSLSSIQC